MTGLRRRLLVWAVAGLAALIDHWELVTMVVLVALVAGVFVPRHNFLAVIVCGAVAGGVAVGRLSR